MELEAIRFFGYPSKNLPCQFTLKFESAEDLQYVRDLTRLGVLVLRKGDLHKLREQTDAVRDRGSKHPSKGLHTHLLDSRKRSTDHRMPLISCDYQDSGRIKSSIQGLLERAAQRGERNTYIIGIQSGLFETLKAELDSVGDTSLDRQSASKPKIESDLPWPEEMLNLLHIEPVPEEVSSRYLGTSTDVQLVHQLILRAAKLAQPVLIAGESGTGKELVAWSIHEQSDRRTGPFRAVNCGAIPAELFESELFGTTRTAFTGAGDKEGLWKQAQGGTLFLDEIRDLAPNHQVKILRAMQEGTIRRVGGLVDEPVDARIIAATNRNLAALVQSGKFREDLYYRVHGFVIYTPALRSHPEDIPQMAIKFWSNIAGKDSKTLSSSILEELKGRRWLGNGRELKMFLTSLHGLFGDQKVTLRHLRVVDGHPGMRVSPGNKSGAAHELSLHRMDQLRHYRKILEVLSSLKTSLRPVLVENLVDPRTLTLARVVLESYMEKIESLSSKMDLFSSGVTRRSVVDLGDALRDFSRVLETGADRAREFWQKHVQPRYQSADSGCIAEIQKLLDRVGK